MHCEVPRLAGGSSRCIPRSTHLRAFPGGANRDRTGDLLLAKQALSQLSYGPNPVPGRVSLGGSGWIRTIDPRLIKTML